MHRCGWTHLRLAANGWGLQTSDHAQSFGRTCLRLNPSRQTAARVLETRWCEALTAKVLCARSHASCGEEEMPPEHNSVQIFPPDATQWWNSRRSRQTIRSHGKNSMVGLFPNNPQKPPWVDSQRAPLDSGMLRSPNSVSSSNEEHGAFIRKLCEYGRITDAVDALNVLVQRGRHIDKNLFYRAIKRCKDLTLSRRIHALTVESGYGGDAFLATHLIGLYASHGRLVEAIHVFTKVSIPDAYNWTAIIFAYARHGEAAEAIRLYRQMRESPTVKPDNCTYVAVLTACATARDLVAGKEVHGHILASPAKPDIVVRTALVNMYAKCGSIEDARSMFHGHPARNVVLCTSMITGYAQLGMGLEALSFYNSMQQEGFTPDSVTYVCLLQACAGVGIGALDQGKQLHQQIENQGLLGDLVVGGSLVNMYAKCGSLEDARIVFDRLSDKNVIIWTAMIAAYAQKEMGQEALRLYRSMQEEGVITPNSVTFVCLLQACSTVGVAALDQGKQLHAQIEKRGLQENVVLGGSLVSMYAKCGTIEDARKVFGRLATRNVVTWNVMISGYVQQGMGEEALSLYGFMQQEGLTVPDSVTFVCLLQACSSVGGEALRQGKQFHAQIEALELQGDEVLGGSLVDMYAKCGSIEDARRVFDELPVRNVVSWTAMIAGYAQQEMGKESLSLYSSMQQEGLTTPNSVTFACLLQACASIGFGALDRGKQLHAQIEERALQDDLVVGGSLVNMYSHCSVLGDARSVFDSLPARNVVTWNVMIASYAQQEMGQEALSLYSSMQQEGLTPPDNVAFVCLLLACASVGVGALDQGRKLHSQIEERGLHSNVVLGGSLVNMYAKCDSLEDARSVFDKLPARNVVTWNTMIAAYSQQGMGQDALSLYDTMQQEGIVSPDSITFICLLQACASLGVGALHYGKQVHARIAEDGVQDNLVLGGSLVSMYAKCSGLEVARSVFDGLADKNVVTWNAMISGYAEQGMDQDALRLYSSMKDEGIATPDSFTFVCLLQACVSVADLHMGKQLHAQIEERELQADVVVGSALVNMYAKCGSMIHSQQMFDSLPERTLETWNALIGGYARQGDSEVVFYLLERMKLEGIQPNGITFLGVLTVCSHVGLVDKGRKSFEAMTTVYMLTPTVEHYTCMMDLLGRAGDLHEALWMAKTMPVPPDGTVWRTLLGACLKWNNVEIGQQAFEFAVHADGKDSAPYVLMSNIYARAQMWDEASDLQARRVKLRAWKKPGQSWWTDMCGVVHTFVAGDKHPD